MNEINRTLGLILGKLDGLAKEIADIRDDMSDSESKADVSRSGIHRRLDEVVMRTTHLETDLVTIKRDVGDAKTITDEVRQWKQRGIGALFVTGIAASAISGTVVGFLVYWWDVVLKALRGG